MNLMDKCDVKKTILCDTKVDRDGDKVRTKLTLDLTGLTWGDVLEYAVRAIVIRIQDMWRRNNNIPADVTISVAKPGSKTISLTYEDALAAFIPDADFRAKMIERHGSAEAAVIAIRKLAMGEQKTH